MSRSIEVRPAGLVVVRNSVEVPQGHVMFHSSTLRDGQQHTGAVYSEAGKDRVAQIEYEVLNPAIIEGGWPGANDTDTNFFKLARKQPYHDRLSAFGMLRRPGVEARRDKGLNDLLAAEAPILTLVGKTHPLQVENALLTDKEENIAMIESSIALARAEGRRVIYDAEHFFDGFRFDPEYAMRTLHAAARAGAESIALCDTNGGRLPSEIKEAIDIVMADTELHKMYRENYGLDVEDDRIKMPLGIHAHNDLELAVANSMTAVDAGVTYIQGTAAGKGERVGNANLTVLAFILDRQGYYKLSDEQKKQLTTLDNTVYEEAGLPKNPNQPLTGSRTFGTQSGMHQSAMLRDPSSYVHVDPVSVGNYGQEIFLSGQSGRSAVLSVMKDWGFSPDTEIAQRVINLIKSKENQGYRWVGQEASVELLIRRQFPDYEKNKPFTLEKVTDMNGRTINATVSFDNNSHSISLPIENEDVDSLYGNLRHIMGTQYPELQSVRSVNSHIVKINGKTRAFITVTNGTETWTTVGVGKDKTEAGLEAAADALEFALYHPLQTSHED